ncbi:hypothetical protein CE91St19_19390 [Odoribacter laneus]|nr:hypothetical protein CE91St19_19390 [Odoribacter laneus]GKI24980.1 hypothetical protein CE91St20_11170 [Odoribacter laneus]
MDICVGFCHYDRYCFIDGECVNLESGHEKSGGFFKNGMKHVSGLLFNLFNRINILYTAEGEYFREREKVSLPV